MGLLDDAQDDEYISTARPAAQEAAGRKGGPKKLGLLKAPMMKVNLAAKDDDDDEINSMLGFDSFDLDLRMDDPVPTAAAINSAPAPEKPAQPSTSEQTTGSMGMTSIGLAGGHVACLSMDGSGMMADGGNDLMDDLQGDLAVDGQADDTTMEGQAADAEASSGLQANYYETLTSAEAVAAEAGAPAHSETDRQAALVSEVEDAGGEMRVHGAMPAEESDHANGTGAEETMAFQSVEPGSDGGPPDTPTTPSSQHQVHAQPAYSDPPAEMDASMATGGHDTNSTGMDQPPPHKLPAAGSVVTQVADSAQGVSAHTDSAAGQQSLLGAGVSSMDNHMAPLPSTATTPTSASNTPIMAFTAGLAGLELDSGRTCKGGAPGSGVSGGAMGPTPPPRRGSKTQSRNYQQERITLAAMDDESGEMHTTEACITTIEIISTAVQVPAPMAVLTKTAPIPAPAAVVASNQPVPATEKAQAAPHAVGNAAQKFAPGKASVIGMPVMGTADPMPMHPSLAPPAPAGKGPAAASKPEFKAAPAPGSLKAALAGSGAAGTQGFATASNAATSPSALAPFSFRPVGSSTSLSSPAFMSKPASSATAPTGPAANAGTKLGGEASAAASSRGGSMDFSFTAPSSGAMRKGGVSGVNMIGSSMATAQRSSMPAPAPASTPSAPKQLPKTTAGAPTAAAPMVSHSSTGEEDMAMQAAAEELEVIPNLSPPPEPELPLFAMMPAQAHPTEELPLPAHAQSPPPAAVQAPMMRTAAAMVKPTPGRAADQASYDQAPAPVTAPFTPTSTPSAAHVPDMRMPGPAAKPSVAMHVPSMPPALPMAKDMQQAEPGGNAAGKLDISFGDMSNATKRLEMMLQDVAGLREGLMETRVSAAIASSRMVRLDNPITRAKLTALKRRAEEVVGVHSAANKEAAVLAVAHKAGG